MCHLTVLDKNLLEFAQRHLPILEVNFTNNKEFLWNLKMGHDLKISVYSFIFSSYITTDITEQLMRVQRGNTQKISLRKTM